MLSMRSVALLLITLVSAWSSDLSADSLSRSEALAIAEHTANDRGVDLGNYELSKVEKELSEDGQEWSFLYTCKLVSSSSGCHVLVRVDRASGAAELSASASEPPKKRRAPEIRAALDSATKEECEKHRGTWIQTGMAQQEFCDIEAPDAGKQCTDNSQCESACVDPAPMQTHAGAQVIGQCDKWHHRLGRCVSEVISGMTKGAICVD